MTTDVAAVRSDTSYREMAALLRSRRVSGLPVVDAEGIVVGVVSETDLLERALEPGQDRWPHRKHVTAAELTVSDLMSHPAVTTTDPARHVEGLASRLDLHRARRLRRRDRDGQAPRAVAGRLAGQVPRRPSQPGPRPRPPGPGTGRPVGPRRPGRARQAVRAPRARLGHARRAQSRARPGRHRPVLTMPADGGARRVPAEPGLR
jgi:CBS domain-containing protein